VREIHNPFREPRGRIAEKILQSESIRKAGKKILPRFAGPALKVIFEKKQRNLQCKKQKNSFRRNL